MRTPGLALRALVPVSMRSEDERGMLGNRLAVVRAPLPVYAQDPVERLRIVREEMAKVKQSKQVMGAETLVALNDFAPPTMLAQASRLNFSTRLFNLIVTNVPGPQFPLYVLGRELRDGGAGRLPAEQARAGGGELLLQREAELRPARVTSTRWTTSTSCGKGSSSPSASWSRRLAPPPTERRLPRDIEPAPVE